MVRSGPTDKLVYPLSARDHMADAPRVGTR